MSMDRKFSSHRSPVVANLERRLFLKRGLSLGALSLLAGCDITDQEGVQSVLLAMSRWNDGVQDWLFDPKRLAPEFPESQITRPFPFNGYYPESEVREIDGSSYKLELAGMIREKKPWTLAELYALPQVSQVTRHICVEGWSAIGKWSGVRFSDFLLRIGADTGAKYVGFQCADSRIPSTSPPSSSPTNTPAGIGKTRATTGTAAPSRRLGSSPPGRRAARASGNDPSPQSLRSAPPESSVRARAPAPASSSGRVRRRAPACCS